MSKTIENEITDIIVILDRSTSIQTYGLVEKNIEGFNSFLKEQKNGVGKARLTLALFDGNTFAGGPNDAYELRYNMVDIENVPELNSDTYVPKGMTALYDAIGMTLQNYKTTTERQLASEKADKVVILIMTDGQENASKEFTKQTIAEMVKKHEDEDSWGFVFIGANIDAMGESTSLNMSVGNTVTYTSTSADTVLAYQKLSASVKKVRGQSKVMYSATLDNFAVTDDSEVKNGSDSQ